jgi:hypothetical protein
MVPRPGVLLRAGPVCSEVDAHRAGQVYSQRLLSGTYQLALPGASARPDIDGRIIALMAV